MITKIKTAPGRVWRGITQIEDILSSVCCGALAADSKVVKEHQSREICSEAIPSAKSPAIRLYCLLPTRPLPCHWSQPIRSYGHQIWHELCCLFLIENEFKGKHRKLVFILRYELTFLNSVVVKYENQTSAVFYSAFFFSIK